MRNVFDQYSQPENQVTHALMTALNEDRSLLDSFLRRFAGRVPSATPSHARITVQSYPEMAASDVDQEEDSKAASARGIPDAWVTAGEDWCLVIETKVLATPDVGQLRRHMRTAARLGYGDARGLLLTVARPQEVPARWCVAEWTKVYKWLRARLDASIWAERVADYLEIMEARLVSGQQLKSGTMTTFEGFGFGEKRPYTSLEAKRLLLLAMEALGDRSDLWDLGVDPVPGRRAVRVRGADVVWDVFTFRSSRFGPSKPNNSGNFTGVPHLTLGIGREKVSAMVTLPNGTPRRRLKPLLSVGVPGFRKVIEDVLARMRGPLKDCPGMSPRLCIQQRRLPFGKPHSRDAFLDIDLRTMNGDRDADPMVKPMPAYVETAFRAFRDKKSANVELQIGAAFPYRTCHESIGTPNALDHIAAAWIACTPFIEKLRAGES